MIDTINRHIVEEVRPRMRVSPTLKDVIVWGAGFQTSSGTLSLGMALGQGTGCSPFCGCAAKQIAELLGEELRQRFPEIKRTVGSAAFPSASVLEAWGVEGAALPPAPTPKRKIPEDHPMKDQGTRVFKVTNSQRCYRFKPDALGNHAPTEPGLYEFVAFDEKRNPEVLFVGLSGSRTIQDCLQDHLDGRLEPTAASLFAHNPDIYFDFIEETDARSPEDYQDVAATLVARHQPRFNGLPVRPTGRFERVEVEEL